MSNTCIRSKKIRPSYRKIRFKMIYVANTLTPLPHLQPYMKTKFGPLKSKSTLDQQEISTVRPWAKMQQIMTKLNYQPYDPRCLEKKQDLVYLPIQSETPIEWQLLRDLQHMLYWQRQPEYRQRSWTSPGFVPQYPGIQNSKNGPSEGHRNFSKSNQYCIHNICTSNYNIFKQ